ncbi:ThiF family adenylyltransferase [Flectobacillus sp. DC10W]|uniref:ThiF family adenylyltransferase n=1 Tax=Flectobacillus longus TaxID=2984207 RepID=A0ABT6YMR3_9BACT|nr:ThiF family adenylyltransferase [Flectobacillus longus]MDI9864476.1 ThiF family adenylyltransferase [Flectobacillus longus]
MSLKLVNHSPDLKRLRDVGYNIEVRDTLLFTHFIPYLNGNGELKFGTLISQLSGTFAPVGQPTNHVSYFIGEHPCQLDGSKMTYLQIGENETVGSGVQTNFTFSHKFKDRQYSDYFELVETYVNVISASASVRFPDSTAKTFMSFMESESDSSLCYPDSNASRANIQHLSEVFKDEKVAVIGVGGTGSYLLDFLSKINLKEIHLFDGDLFEQHNAFRAPGAAAANEVESPRYKVDYFADIYSKMNLGIRRHIEYVDEKNINLLKGMSFVFICVDKNSARHKIAHFLMNEGIPFIDCGIGLNLIKGKLSYTIRITCSINGKFDHINKNISGVDVEPGLYSSNIQIAEINAFAAVLAVQLWKKKRGFYYDDLQEYNIVFSSLLGTIDYED